MRLISISRQARQRCHLRPEYDGRLEGDGEFERLADATGQAESGGALRPSVAVKLSYALGEFARWGGFDTALPFVFFYYTAVLGLSGGLVGAALAVSLAVDALIDPLVGSWSDNIRSRLGRRLPLMLAAIPLMFVAMGAMFSPPRLLSPAGLFLWLTVFCVAIRSFISLFNVPYAALGAELADGYAERSSVVAYRTVAGIASGIIITALAFSLFFVGKGGLQTASAYPGFGWSVAGLLLVACSICWIGVRRYAAGLPQPAGVEDGFLRRLPPELGEIFRNTSFRVLFISAMVFYAAVGLNVTLQSHAYVFVWKLPPRLIQLVTYAYLLGILLGVALTPLLTRWFEKKTVVLIGLVAVIFAWTVLIGLRAFGVFAPAGAAALPPLAANAFFAGVGVGFVAIAYPSMMADAADEHEFLFGSRREGLYFAGLAFAAKAATGAGVLLAGYALDLIGFPAHPQGGTSLIAEGVLTRLMLAHGPAAALIGVVAMTILAPYGISRVRHDVISQGLRAKRAGRPSAPSLAGGEGA